MQGQFLCDGSSNSTLKWLCFYYFLHFPLCNNDHLICQVKKLTEPRVGVWVSSMIKPLKGFSLFQMKEG